MSLSAPELKTAGNVQALLGPSNEPWQVNLTDPAVSVMTDFRVRSMFRLSPDETIDAALEKMKIAGLRIAFVFEKGSENVLGMITAYDIMGEKPMRYMQDIRLNDHHVLRKDIKVGDLLDPVSAWVTATLHDVERVTVQSVLIALQKSGRTHLPVIEPGDGGTPRLRGLFSSAKILRLSEASRQQAGKGK